MTLKTLDLCLAVEAGDKVLVADLMRLGADVNKLVDHSESAMEVAAAKGDVDMVMLLMGFGASVHRLDTPEGHIHTRMSPMSSACCNGHVEVVKLLHRLGADLNDVESNHGYSAMILAAEFGHKDVVLYLINQGADYHHKNHSGTTAKNAASGEGYHHVCDAMDLVIRILEIRNVCKLLHVDFDIDYE